MKEESCMAGAAKGYQSGEILEETIYEEDKKQYLQSQAILSFVVGKRGDISDVKVIQTPHRCLSDAVTGVVKRMPRWSPGRVSGFPVKVRYTSPFKFKLE